MSAGIKDFIDSTNSGYEQVHRRFEEQFWGTKMALSNGTPLADGKGPTEYSVDELTRTKMEMEAFLADSAKLEKTREFLAKPGKHSYPPSHTSTSIHIHKHTHTIARGVLARCWSLEAHLQLTPGLTAQTSCQRTRSRL